MAKVQIKSEKLTLFGGFFSIMEQFDSTLSSAIDSTLGLRCSSFGYQYSEIIRSLMSIYFCGGSCVEDVTTHLMNQKVPITCIAMGGLTVAFLCQLIHIEKPAYLANVSIGISLYTLGYLWKEKQFYKKYASMAIALYLGIMIIWPSHIDLRNNTLYGNSIYILAIVFSISGCIVINNLLRYLPKLQIINYIGKNSMLYYVTHMLILELVMLIPFEQLGISGYIVFVIMCASCLILPPMIKKIFLFVNPAKLSSIKKPE